MIYKYLNFVNENYYDNELDVDLTGTKFLTKKEFEYCLKEYCSDFDWKDKPIYKSTNAIGNNKMGYFDASNPPQYYLHNNKKLRKSAYAANIYTLMLNHLPSWSNYPKRQVICSTETRGAFGKSYRVIPFNGSEWGVVPSDDIQTNGVKLPLKMIKKLKSMNLKSAYGDITKLYLLNGLDLNWVYNYKSLKKGIEDLGIGFKEFGDLMKPKDMEFELKTYKELINYNFPNADNQFTSNKQCEIWTDSDVLLYDVNSESI